MSKRRLKALVVDDEKSVRSLLIAWLFREGFLCNEADDGTKALREIEHGQYDLVVADLRMPNQNGHALCQSILRLDGRPRVVVLTGVNDARLLRDLESRGVDHIFQKPVNPSEFVARIRELTRDADLSLRLESNPASTEFASNVGERYAADDGRRPTVGLLLHDARRAGDVAAELKRQSFLPFVSTNTDALCDLVESRHLDLLVLENARYGFLSARDLVGHLKASAASTGILLLAEENASPETVAGWPIAPKLISRNASDSEIVQAVRGKITARNRGRGGIAPAARELARPFASASGPHQFLLSLAKHLRQSDTEPTPAALANEVSQDDNAAAELLKLAKGASAGLRGQIANVSEAINRLGVRRSTALLVATGIKGAEKTLLRRMPTSLREWYQRRSTLNAAIGAVFAQGQFGLSGDRAFVFGLLQDIGIVALGSTFEERYARLVSRARASGHAHLHVIEREDLKIDHAEISAAILEQWGLSEEFITAVRVHHGLKAAEREVRESALVVDAMRTAESIAELCDNRHPARREQFIRHLASCCDGAPEKGLCMLDKSVRLAAEIAEHFRAPYLDEAALRSAFRDIHESADWATSTKPCG